MKSEIRNPKSKIAIVGAGPAGAAAAIRLANAGFDVSLIEREKFPRHKLCGEFISPECLKHFRALGVLDEMLAAGGESISETVFYAPNGKQVGVPSKWLDGNSECALSLSRAEMDSRLLAGAKRCGVEVLEQSQVVGVLQENDSASGVKLRKKTGEIVEINADFVIDATGRARVLSKMAEKKTAAQKSKTKNYPKSKIIGFKAHLENVRLEKKRCEIYFFRGGYGGLSFVENDLANHCFLIEAETVKKFGGDANEIVEKVVFQNRRARFTMRDAKPVHNWLAVSIDNFGAQNLSSLRNLYAIGDAGAFIDPFTGSGMLMALESAEILARTIAENLSSPETIAEKYSIFHQRKFGKRLRICSVMRRLAFAPTLAGLMIFALGLSEKPREILARATRQNNRKNFG